jgi:hypothetical protein
MLSRPMFRIPTRLLALLFCASCAMGTVACAGSMQGATTTGGVIKRPVRASKGSVEKSSSEKTGKSETSEKSASK